MMTYPKKKQAAVVDDSGAVQKRKGADYYIIDEASHWPIIKNVYTEGNVTWTDSSVDTSAGTLTINKLQYAADRAASRGACIAAYNLLPEMYNVSGISSICDHSWKTSPGLDLIDPTYQGLYQSYTSCTKCGDRK